MSVIRVNPKFQMLNVEQVTQGVSPEESAADKAMSWFDSL